MADAVTGQDRINFYPDASEPEYMGQARAVSSLAGARAYVSFVFERPSPDTNESDRKSRTESSPETIRQGNPR
jgi:hypothetical protein